MKIMLLDENDAMVKSTFHLCEDTSIVEYYKGLHNRHKEIDIRKRKDGILNSPKSMTIYYRSIVDVNKECIIYNCLMIDDLRSILSRWRLSNHKLKIETGRYRVPLTPSEERKCVTCNVVEDEYHALFICPCHQEIRTNTIICIESIQMLSRCLTLKEKIFFL